MLIQGMRRSIALHPVEVILRLIIKPMILRITSLLLNIL